MTMEGNAIIQADALRAFVAAVFERAGLAPGPASDAADVLVWANLRGVDTHGVRNLKPLYINLIDQGRIDARARCTVEYETPLTARVDGGGGLGLANACWGMRLAMEKARQSGIGLVAMRHSHHFGAAGYYPWMALQQDLIGIGLTGRFAARGAEIGVVPTFAAVPMFSTNPISIAFPTAEEPPFLLDMATSITPYNRVKMYQELGRILPLGWGMDDQGQPATDPAVVRRLYPLGGSREMGGHKGYGLAMVVEVLCAGLSGEWCDGHDEDDRCFEGYAQTHDAHFFGAIRVDLFRPLEEFKRSMDAMIRALHAAPKEPGQERIYVAGEIEHETEQERRRKGIPLPANVVADLQELSRRFDVPLALGEAKAGP
uniref:Ldh family oxidoreductase n=2 Tax=Litorilinea aerophila TaxID=1204385 RepID=A0A540VKU2_9CHLR